MYVFLTIHLKKEEIRGYFFHPDFGIKTIKNDYFFGNHKSQMIRVISQYAMIFDF